MEEEQALHWAIEASLAEAQSQRAPEDSCCAAAAASTPAKTSTQPPMPAFLAGAANVQAPSETAHCHSTPEERARAAEQRACTAEQALVEIHHRAAACRSETRQLRGELSDSRFSINRLTERLCEVDTDLASATVRLEQLQADFIAAKRLLKDRGLLDKMSATSATSAPASCTSPGASAPASVVQQETLASDPGPEMVKAGAPG